MVYVIDGGGTLTTGGTVVGEKRTNAANLSGTAIDGGTVQTIDKGDFAIIPEGTPHQFKPANGAARVDDHARATAGWRRAVKSKLK